MHEFRIVVEDLAFCVSFTFVHARLFQVGPEHVKNSHPMQRCLIGLSRSVLRLYYNREIPLKGLEKVLYGLIEKYDLVRAFGL